MEEKQTNQGSEEKKDTQTDFSPANLRTKIEKNTVMAILSYVGPLVIIPYLTVKDDEFVKFHVKQGLILMTIEVAIWLLSRVLGSFSLVWGVLNLATTVLSVVGIIYVLQKKQKELPLIGSWSKHFKI